MKKQFLLFLLTLLPLAGWATESADLVTKPTLVKPQYTGDPLKLFVGEATLPLNYDTDNSEAGVVYTVTTSGTAPSGEVEETKEAPTKTDVGLYYVWYKVLKDDGVYDTDSEWKQLGATRITKGSVVFETAPAAVENLTYDGTSTYSLVSAGRAKIVNGVTLADNLILYSLEEEGTYTSNIPTKQDAGTYTVYYKVAGTDNYYGANGSVSVTIDPRAISSFTATLKSTFDATYTGSAITPGVDDFDVTVPNVPTPSYTVTCSNNVNVSTEGASYTVSLTGNYSGSVEGTFAITSKSVSGLEYTLAGKYYTGFETQGLSKVKDGTTELVKGTDYEVAYTNNINKGTATAKITGKGNYTGTKSKNFNVLQRLLTDNYVKQSDALAKIANTDYTGSAVEFTFEEGDIKLVTSSGTYNLIKDTDYEVSYTQDHTNVGTKTVTFTGKGNFSGSLTKNYEIKAVDLTIKAQPITAAYGTTITPTVEYEGLVGGETAANLTGTLTLKYYTNEACTEGETTDVPTEVGTYYYIGSGLTSSNYNISYESAKLVITQGTLIAKLVATENSYTYGDDPQFKLQYVSGLPESETFNVQNVQKSGSAIVDGNGIVGVANYTVKAKGGSEAAKNTTDNKYDQGNYDVVIKDDATYTYGSYNVSIQPGGFTINQKDIADQTAADYDVTIELASAGTYDGTAKKPEITSAKFGAFAVTYNELTDASYSNNTDAGTNTASVTVTGNGNYKGERVINFSIAQRNLTITANNATVTYSALEGEKEEKKFASVTVTGLADADAELATDIANFNTPEKFSGTLTITYTGNSSVGSHASSLVPANLTATNYNISYKNGDLEITPDIAYVKVNNASVIYGEEPSLTYTYVSGLKSDEESIWASIITGTPTYVIDGDKNSNGDPTVGVHSVSLKVDEDGNVEGLSASNYIIKNVAAEYGVLTVSQRPIKITALNQTIDLGVEGQAFTDNVTITDNPDNTADATVLVEKNDAALTGTAIVGDDNLDIAISCVNPTKVGENEITVTASNNNYSIEEVSGILNVTGVNTIALDPKTDDGSIDQLLSDYNGQEVTLNITSLDRVAVNKADCNIMVADRWYSLVLPIPTTVKKLSDALGYAVVDVPNTKNDKVGNISFKLKVDKSEIEANTMILVKTYDDIDLSSNPIELTGTIDYKPSKVVKDDANNEFHCVYEAIEVGTDTEYADGIWFLMSSKTEGADMFYEAAKSNKRTILPLGAYFKTAADPASVRVFVEEADGTVTAINALTLEPETIYGEGWYTVNGVKLNAAPKQKGIFINNGKKVVIK